MQRRTPPCTGEALTDCEFSLHPSLILSHQYASVRPFIHSWSLHKRLIIICGHTQDVVFFTERLVSISSGYRSSVQIMICILRSLSGIPVKTSRWTTSDLRTCVSLLAETRLFHYDRTNIVHLIAILMVRSTRVVT